MVTCNLHKNVRFIAKYARVRGTSKFSISHVCNFFLHHWFLHSCVLPSYTFKHAHSGSVRGWIRSTCKCNRKTEECHWRGSDIPECDINRSSESRHCSQIKTTALTRTECLDDCNSRSDCSNWLFSSVNSECFMDVCKVPTLPSYFTADLTRNQQYQKSQNMSRALRFQTKHSQHRHML